MTHISYQDIMGFPKRYRTHFINSLNGYKSANLIGTVDGQGQENLAVFSSVIHLGSNPPLLGMVTRPAVVPRHTYENIEQTGFYTINHIHPGIAKAAHQSSARYDKEVSEFRAVGLTPEYLPGFFAPFVAESRLKIGMELQESLPIRSNGTVLLVGKIHSVLIPKSGISEDGWVDLPQLETLAISGLDSYHSPQMLHRLAYAKVGKKVEELPED